MACGFLSFEMIKEATVFTNGDSSAIRTWSNVPYFFTETLLAKGIKVNRVDIGESPRKKRLFDRTIMRVVRRIAPGTTYDYFRSPVHFNDVKRRIKLSLASHPDSNANIFLTYSFSSAGFSNVPTVLFCDWTYEYYLEHFREKAPDIFERASMKREDRQIERSDVVISLFPRVAGFLKKRYRRDKIFYLGNVVNALAAPDKVAILQAKAHSKDIVFVGGRNYLTGANLIIGACRELKTSYPDIRLHIIGMSKEDFGDLPGFVQCHGYLDKARADHKERYYTLLSNARIFVNTTPKWGAFSAMLEALHFYLPVITTPFCECVETFGEKLNFGEYCGDASPQTLRDKIAFIFETSSYTALCLNAHDSVKHFTWPEYMEKVLQRIGDTSASHGRVGD